jgi:hypothetical protein
LMTSVQGTLLRIVSQPIAIELPPVALPEWKVSRCGTAY